MAGDAFGECFFGMDAERLMVGRRAPEPPWPWTDDTAIPFADCMPMISHGAHHIVSEPPRVNTLGQRLMEIAGCQGYLNLEDFGPTAVRVSSRQATGESSLWANLQRQEACEDRPATSRSPWPELG